MMQEKKSFKREFTGKVVSANRDKTVTVLVVYRVKHKIGKYITLHKKLHAHDADNRCALNDTVVIQSCRPISKSKTWVVKEIIDGTQSTRGQS